MKKTKLVIASILKPVDDTRMYEKFGLSLSQTNKYDINIIGFYSKNIPDSTDIRFHPIFDFNRLNVRRLLAPIRCLRLLAKLKPQILIVNTHELLIISWLYKILFGCKLLYDIQENYYRNILYTKAFPLVIKPFIAAYVRAKEYISTLFVNHYFLAERQYEKEFTFSKSKSTVIENKFKPYNAVYPNTKSEQSIRLLFSGTLAESTGVFHAIDFAKKLHTIDDRIELQIIGHCAIPSTLKRIQKSIETQTFIHLTGGAELVPHALILEAIANADFGIVYYPTNYSTMNSTPTKLYEYLGCRLPMLLQNHQPWVSLAEKHNACLVVDSHTQFDKNFIRIMENSAFYKNASSADILWGSEEEKLLDIINKYRS